MIVQEDIENGLRALGLGPGDAVEVHSSLSSFGRVEGGAAVVVDALMAVVGEEGALVMSAYPVSKPLPLTETEKARGILAKVQLFGEDYDGPTGMGVIADEFRHRPGTMLGPGFHRVCAWGRDAALHAERGYAHLLEVDGWVLLLGVGIGYCSSMHQAEIGVDFPEAIKRYWQAPEDIRRDYPDDIYLSYGKTPDDAWGKVQDEAERREQVWRHRIGQAECVLFKARVVVGIYREWLLNDPFGLHGVAQEV
ncbi:MAG: AAC(3) family N-acetyltransferase [Anaerolineae bacterium]|nr:AAC(3) family N-acetyltransferase [Anaerolineae bacterium]